jgi:hypothetical protein
MIHMFSLDGHVVDTVDCQRRSGIEPIWRGGWGWLPGFDGEIAASPITIGDRFGGRAAADLEIASLQSCGSAVRP